MSKSPKMVQVTLCQGQTKQVLEIRSGLGLQALPAQRLVEFDCRKADCGICLVKVVSPTAEAVSEAKHRELDFLKAMHADPEERLSCQMRIFKDVTLNVPEP